MSPCDVTRLLQLDGSASFFELLLQLLGFVLCNAFLYGFRRSFDEVFSFFQAQASDGTDFFNDVDFLFACGGQNNVKGVFFFSNRSSIAATSPARKAANAISCPPAFRLKDRDRVDGSRRKPLKSPGEDQSGSKVTVSPSFGRGIGHMCQSGA